MIPPYKIMKEMFADEASLNLLSTYDILKNQTFILHLMINSEYFLVIKDIFGGLAHSLGLQRCYFGELMGDNRGRNPCCDIAWSARNSEY